MSAFGGSTSLLQAMAAQAASANNSLSNMNDVSLNNPQTNDTLAYNAGAESKITNLTTDLASKVSSINTITPTSGNVSLALTNLSNVSATAPTNNKGLIYNTSKSNWKVQQIDHTTLANIGTNTHSQIDSFIASKAQASGLAPLDSGTNVPLANLVKCVSNTITFYVDSKYRRRTIAIALIDNINPINIK